MNKVETKADKTMQAEKEMRNKMEETRTILKQMMRDGKLPEARAMKRSERKRLNTAGLNLNNYKAGLQKNFTELQEEMCDWILDHVYPEFDFDDLPNNIGYVFALHTYMLTYQDDLAEKN